MKTIRVLPGKDEDRFMELYKQFKYPKNTVCRLGAIFGKPYNEIDIPDYDYDRFEEELEAINYITKGEPVKMSFVEKVKKFVKEHDVECVLGVVGIAAFVAGIMVGDTVSSAGHMEQLKKATCNGIGVGGVAGMTTIAGFINDKVPEANKLISDYCSENNVDFEQLFHENPIVIDATKRIGEIALPKL